MNSIVDHCIRTPKYSVEYGYIQSKEYLSISLPLEMQANYPQLPLIVARAF